LINWGLIEKFTFCTRFFSTLSSTVAVHLSQSFFHQPKASK